MITIHCGKRNMKKISLYNLSLIFLYISVIILTIDIPICFGEDCKFIGLQGLFSIGIILPTVCFALIIWGGLTFCTLKGWLRSTPDTPKKIVDVHKANECYLEFLAAYVIPLVCFNFTDIRQVSVFLIFYLLIGWIYIRTDLFCTNPTLAFLGYDVYKVTYEIDNGKKQEVFAFADKKILTMEGKRVRFINVDKSIYMIYNPPKEA